MEPKTTPKETSRYYWAGAYIAFGVSPTDTELQTRMRLIIILIHLTGGLAGGFLVNLRSTVGWLQGGIVTGVMAYVLEQIVHTVLYGWGAIGDEVTMYALIGGSVVGALALEFTDIKKKQVNAVENGEEKEKG